MIRIVYVLSLILSCPPVRADDSKADAAATAESASVQPLRIEPRSHAAWGDDLGNVRAILEAAAGELWRYFPGRELAMIDVEPRGGPIVLFKRGPRGEYRVRLETGERLWSQWVYQFSHEFGHILAQYSDVDYPHKWFEEVLCEIASLFVLRRLAETWDGDDVPSRWRKYASSHRKYVERLLETTRLPDDQDLAAWYRQHAEALARSAELRRLNAVAAAALLPVFEAAPESWAALSKLGDVRADAPAKFGDFLEAWRDQCPARHRGLVERIARKFGLALARNQGK